MVRPFRQPEAEALWRLKRGFELGLGDGTGDDEKAAAYREKLDDEYREGYLAWVRRCQDEEIRAVQVAEAGEGSAAGESGDTGATADGDDDLVGYAFVLPSSMAHIWDAAVLNELYVVPEYRGTGVADDLMDATLAVARSQDLPLDRLVLDVDRQNDRAQAFYDRWGFEHWGEMVARDL